jgi:uncharacterized protein
MSLRFWEDVPLDRLDKAQWEALCDGCGKCCLHKLEDDETGQVFPTNVACRLLDRRTGQCTNYANRRAHVPDCIQLSRANILTMEWLPESCAYVRRANGLPLPDWHYLNTGDRDSIHDAGASVRGWTISEVDAGDLEHHILDDEDGRPAL